MLAGCYSIMTHKADFDAMTALDSCRLRDGQEKLFQQMKDQTVSDRQRSWPEGGETGRLFILLVSRVLSPHARHAWASAKLGEIFESPLKMPRAMRPVRCIERPLAHDRMITPLSGRQLDVCEAFCFEAPAGRAPACAAPRRPKRKRGRPPKKKTGWFLKKFARNSRSRALFKPKRNG